MCFRLGEPQLRNNYLNFIIVTHKYLYKLVDFEQIFSGCSIVFVMIMEQTC